MEYKVIQSGLRTFNLTRDGQLLGEMTYVKWNPSKSAIMLATGESYQIKPKGFWRQTTEILQADQPIMSFRMRWRSIEIVTMNEPVPRTYHVKIKGLWKGDYQLLDESKQALL